MLHIVSSKNSVNRVLENLSNHDVVLFLGDGVFNTCNFDNVPVYVIDDDLRARGVRLPSGVKAVNYCRFVELVVETDKSITW